MNATSGVLESMKEPLENRVWFNYPGDRWPGITGSSDEPSKIARVIEDGSTQIWQYHRNALSYVTRAVDPLGRETLTDYAANGIDVIQVRQKNGTSYDTIASFSWNSQHRPLTVTDAAGKTTPTPGMPAANCSQRQTLSTKRRRMPTTPRATW